MFRLRLREPNSIISLSDLDRKSNKLHFAIERVDDSDLSVGAMVSLEPSEVGIVARALEVTSRVLLGQALGRFKKVLELEPAVGGQVRFFIPTDQSTQAILWVHSGGGESQGAVYLGADDLEAIGEWAHGASRLLKEEAAKLEDFNE